MPANVFLDPAIATEYCSPAMCERVFARGAGMPEGAVLCRTAMRHLQRNRQEFYEPGTMAAISMLAGLASNLRNEAP